jgi:hypothetical protein
VALVWEAESKIPRSEFEITKLGQCMRNLNGDNRKLRLDFKSHNEILGVSYKWFMSSSNCGKRLINLTGRN